MDGKNVSKIINGLAKRIHRHMNEKGFWPKKIDEYDMRAAIAALKYANCVHPRGAQVLSKALDKLEQSQERNLGEAMMLMVTELSEGFETVRRNGPNTESEKIPSYTHLEEELADTIIRILDYAGGMGLDIGGAIMAKVEHNRDRPYKHGKRF